MTFYVLLATFTMLSLNVLNVPMTVFSFLGGALAIGAGFGSQNIVNNFISGLILLVERPIRVGDVIELDGTTGTVTQIGARSTKIATGANHEIIVPNSKLLETSVVNWTLTDDIVGCVDQGRRGLRLAHPRGRAAAQARRPRSTPKSSTSPAPEVVLADFGADALHVRAAHLAQLAADPQDRSRKRAALRHRRAASPTAASSWPIPSATSTSTSSAPSKSASPNPSSTPKPLDESGATAGLSSSVFPT